MLLKRLFYGVLYDTGVWIDMVIFYLSLGSKGGSTQTLLLGIVKLILSKFLLVQSSFLKVGTTGHYYRGETRGDESTTVTSGVLVVPGVARHRSTEIGRSDTTIVFFG